MNNNHHANSKCIGIVDAGSQYGKLIDRKLRELNIRTVILDFAFDADELTAQNVRGLVISGGPGTVILEDEEFNKLNGDRIIKLGLPVLGICFGMQLLNRLFGGAVERTDLREDGECEIEIDTKCALFNGLSSKQLVLLTHGDTCTKVGEKLKVVGKHGDTISAISHESSSFFGVQFHPETDLTPNGKTMFKNFCNICGVESSYTLNSRLKASIEELRQCIDQQQNNVVCLVSGGVDSAVCAAMLQKAVGKDKIIPVHIDNGFMRLNESKLVEKSLSDIGINLDVYNEARTFSMATTKILQMDDTYRSSLQLNKTVHPEDKRQIIGDCFISVYNRILVDRGLDVETTLLAQGTLRPDLIESGSIYASAKSDRIKTHHNDTDLVRALRARGKVIEPLKDFHKDEVRQIGAELKLSQSILQRHPFPGPGLAIRILCAEAPNMGADFVETQVILNKIVTYNDSKRRPFLLFNKIVEVLTKPELEMLDKITGGPYMYKSTLLPINSVGVQGDARTYSYCAAFSCSSKSIGTASSSPSDQQQLNTTPGSFVKGAANSANSQPGPNWDHLFFLARIIPRCCHNINRVAYVFGGEVSHAVNDITVTYLDAPTVDLLRTADDIAMTTLKMDNCLKSVSQMPVVMIPIHFDRDPVKRVASIKRSIVLRTFKTQDFMTGVPARPGKDIPESVLNKINQNILKLPGISRVLYDLTSKPPATTEWE